MDGGIGIEGVCVCSDSQWSGKLFFTLEERAFLSSEHVQSEGQT